jgi:hypothetical protein
MSVVAEALVSNGGLPAQSDRRTPAFPPKRRPLLVAKALVTMNLGEKGKRSPRCVPAERADHGGEGDQVPPINDRASPGPTTRS